MPSLCNGLQQQKALSFQGPSFVPVSVEIGLEGSKGSMKGKLKRAGWDDSFLARLLTYRSQNQMR
jgi:hypothetical protein